MNTTPAPKDNNNNRPASPAVDIERPPEGTIASSAVAKEISDATRESITENARLREELHAFMLIELKQPSSVIARPSSRYTYITKSPTVLPPKFYALLGLEESMGDRCMYCKENNGRVHLGLYPITNGQENIVYSFSTIEGSTTS